MFEQLKRVFDEDVLTSFNQSPAMIHVAKGNVTPLEYGSFLKQIYYVVRENPQLQALSTSYLRGEQREVIRRFYQHATSEIDHDQLCLNDIETLGQDAALIPFQNPLPESIAMTSFAHYQICFQNPVSYLGYLFFLEFLPTQAGGALTAALSGAGIPASAMTFIRDHIEIDQAHNRMMVQYADLLLKDRADFDAAVYVMKTIGHFYAEMLGAAIKDAHEPKDTGWNWREIEQSNIDIEALVPQRAAG